MKPNSLLSNYPLKARYKNRTPDPGICVITSINWRDKGLSMSNGACEYFPSFSEVEIVEDSAIYNYLDLSTAHITSEDAQLLEDQGNNDVFCSGNYDVGCFISVPEFVDMDELNNAGFSDSLYEVLIYAQEKGCQVVRLDRDAEVLDVKELDTYKW